MYWILLVLLIHSSSSSLTTSPSFLRTCQKTAGSSCWWRRASISSRPTRMSSPLARVTSSAWLARRTAAGGKERSMAGPGGFLATMSVRSKAPVGVDYRVILPLHKPHSPSSLNRPPSPVRPLEKNKIIFWADASIFASDRNCRPLHFITLSLPLHLASTHPWDLMWWEVAVPNLNTQ